MPVVVPAAAPPRRAAAFFDLDHTVLATSSMSAFAPRFRAGGLTTNRALLRLAYAQLVYHLSAADAEGTERLRRSLSRLVAGWDAAKVNAIAAQTLHEVITPKVFAEAVELMEHHHAAGRDVVIISASGMDIVAPIARMLGADHAAASRMEIVEGRYTGILDFYCYGPAKAQAMEELAAAHGYDLQASYAYSDSITDAPMLQAVGHATVVNPDRALRRLALGSGWEVARFSKPTPLRPPLTRGQRVALWVAGGAVACAGVGAGLLLAARRSHRA